MTSPYADHFPFVNECPECGGFGLKIIRRFPTSRLATRLEYCTICEGRGRVIPPEWIEESRKNG